MKIVIDLQSAQASNRDRGIGRYSTALTKAFVQEASLKHELWLVANSSLGNVESIREDFDGLVPQERIVSFTVLQNAGGAVDSPKLTDAGELLRENFLRSLDADFVWCNSLFEGSHDNSVTSIGRLPTTALQAVTLYDLIPLSNKEYLADSRMRNWYYRKLSQLQRADILFAISESVRQDAMKLLNIEPKRILAISTAVDGSQWLEEGGHSTWRERAKTSLWQASARRVLEALESRVQSGQQMPLSSTCGRAVRPRLAYVSPLPPERTGIAGYSAELLPALERYYDIEVVVEQACVDDLWVTANYPLRSASWFRANAHRFDRVLYQVGNSPFHSYQLGLIADFPGVVVMHDAFLGDLSLWRAWHTGRPHDYSNRLYNAHGHRALLDDKIKGRDWTVQNYASSREVLEHATGIIVHSQYAIDQIRSFYGDSLALETCKVNFPKQCRTQERDIWRRRLGIQPREFVVCSFGMVGFTKLNHRALSAWLKSTLSEDTNCHLVFVGENHEGDYGNNLLDTISNSQARKRIQITGYVDDSHYHGWLEAADLAIQLRAQSRGETSASVFDCMGHGLPTVVNAHATFAELDPKAVYLLPDLFNDDDLASALNELYGNPKKRQALSKRGRQIITEYHHPIMVAAQYRDVIENFSTDHFLAREQELSRNLVKLSGQNDAQLWEIATAIRNNRRPRGNRTLFLDVTAIASNDIKTGIQRVIRNIASNLLLGAGHNLRVELVRFHQNCYISARSYACNLLGLDEVELSEEIIEVSPGDIFLGLDLIPWIVSANRAIFEAWRDRGVSVFFTMYDLLPALKPQFFPPKECLFFRDWMDCLAGFADGVICISKTVAKEFQDWLEENCPPRRRPLRIGYSYLGAELDRTQSTPRVTDTPFSTDVADAIGRMQCAPSLLMVGTIEPRKGHRHALQAFEYLWREGHDLNLVVVGKEGWMMDSFIEELRSHPEQAKRLFWLKGVSDQELETLYAVASALLVASEGEGFGLPIIEAARHGISVIARDLPVFREVAGKYAHYFAGDSAEDLGKSILEWLVLSQQGKAPSSTSIPRLTWQESAIAIQDMLLDASHPNWLYSWHSQKPTQNSSEGDENDGSREQGEECTFAL